MLKTRKKSFKKSMAILVCVAFISLFFLGPTYASTKPSSPKFPFIKKSFSLFSSVFSLIDFSFVLGNTDKGQKEEKDKKTKDPYDDHGNRTSKKDPNGKD